MTADGTRTESLDRKPGALARSGRALRRLFFVAAVLFVLFHVGERTWDFVDPLPADILFRNGESRCVYAADGTLLRVVPTPAGERLIRIRLDELSPHLRNALLASEDRRFLSHGGVDFWSVARAVGDNAIKGRIASGASTLTMQLARQLEPHEKSFAQKAHEMLRARQLERILSKDEILEHYINEVPMGGTLRGFEAASRYWFGKSARDLVPHEAATLVALLPAPSRRAPHKYAETLIKRRNVVLAKMQDEGRIGIDEYRMAIAQPLGAEKHPWPFIAPHAVEIALAKEPLKTSIRTSIDVAIQTIAKSAVDRYASSASDGIAVVVIDRANGDTRALIGSRDYIRQPLNAAVRRRSAGSTLKPFLYGLAMEKGIVGPETLLFDTPVGYGGWRPGNFDGQFVGAVNVKDALSSSRNVPAVRLLETVGREPFRRLLADLGIPSSDDIGLDAALGTMEVSPLALAHAYRAFFRGDPDSPISAATRTSIFEILSRESPDPGRLDPGHVAWKTGTSSGRRDAWTVGVTRTDVVVVWEGNLDGRGASHLVGRRTAAPILAEIVSRMLR